MALINNDILKTILGFLGIKEIEASTDTPGAILNIKYTRHRETKEISVSLEEIIRDLQSDDPGGADTAQIEKKDPGG